MRVFRADMGDEGVGEVKVFVMQSLVSFQEPSPNPPSGLSQAL